MCTEAAAISPYRFTNDIAVSNKRVYTNTFRARNNLQGVQIRVTRTRVHKLAVLREKNATFNVCVQTFYDNCTVEISRNVLRLSFFFFFIKNFQVYTTRRYRGRKFRYLFHAACNIDANAEFIRA